MDELSYMSLKPEQVTAFFRLMDQRDNRVTSIIAANRVRFRERGGRRAATLWRDRR